MIIFFKDRRFYFFYTVPDLIIVGTGHAWKMEIPPNSKQGKGVMANISVSVSYISAKL